MRTDRKDWRKLKRNTKRVPWLIALRVAFIERQGLSESQYEEEVKKAARQCLLDPNFYEPGLYELYDEKLAGIVTEVMLES